MAIQRGDSMIGAKLKPGADAAWVGQRLDMFVVQEEGIIDHRVGCSRMGCGHGGFCWAMK